MAVCPYRVKVRVRLAGKISLNDPEFDGVGLEGLEAESLQSC